MADKFTGYTRHGWKKGTRILRHGQLGTIKSNGRYYADNMSGLWYFDIVWDDGTKSVINPWYDDEIVVKAKGR
jgi:hypothetical protein